MSSEKVVNRILIEHGLATDKTMIGPVKAMNDSNNLGFEAIDLDLIVGATGLCPFCAGALRSNAARQCPHCLISWRDIEDVKSRKLAPQFQVQRDVLRLRMENSVLSREKQFEIAWVLKTKAVSKQLMLLFGMMILLSFISFMFKGESFVSGSVLVAIVAIVSFSMIAYLSFVFRRAIGLNFQIFKNWLVLKFVSKS
tara:strand:+ start:664 stop:1254 length:591 start_codon:yes stop_codon:yes gene_type:complete